MYYSHSQEVKLVAGCNESMNEQLHGDKGHPPGPSGARECECAMRGMAPAWQPDCVLAPSNDRTGPAQLYKMPLLTHLAAAGFLQP